MNNIITLHKINDLEIKPIPNPELEGKKIKGVNMFKDVYTNIFLCARKKSGKTSTIFKILRECVGKETNIVIFCSTINKDHNYKYMKKYFEAKGNTWLAYTSLHEDGEDKLTELIKHIQSEADEKEKEEEEHEERQMNPNINNIHKILFEQEEEEKTPCKEKKK